jgi:hypothetical protein
MPIAHRARVFFQGFPFGVLIDKLHQQLSCLDRPP